MGTSASEGSTSMTSSTSTWTASAGREWSASDKLYRPEAVEAELGDRLRLVEYKHQFADEAALTYHNNIVTCDY